MYYVDWELRGTDIIHRAAQAYGIIRIIMVSFYQSKPIDLIVIRVKNLMA